VCAGGDSLELEIEEGAIRQNLSLLRSGAVTLVGEASDNATPIATVISMDMFGWEDLGRFQALIKFLIECIYFFFEMGYSPASAS
jgi:hypothetical protein